MDIEKTLEELKKEHETTEGLGFDYSAKVLQNGINGINVIESQQKEIEELEEQNKKLDYYIINGETKTTLHLSDGTVRLPKNYEGIDG